MRVFRGIQAVPTGHCALTIGNFDGLHRGHQAMLSQLKAYAHSTGLPAYALTFEPHPKERFHPHQAPARLSTLREKLEGFIAHQLDGVIVQPFNLTFANVSASEFIFEKLAQTLGTRYLLVGEDFQFGQKRQGDVSLLKEKATEAGLIVETFPTFLENEVRVSSTAVRDGLANGQLAWVETLLGRPYSMSGRVVHGAKLGRTLGFPTANIHIRHPRCPLSGIFVVRIRGLGQPLYGVASLGKNPTVSKDELLKLEVNIFDFSEEIYGEHLYIDFLHKLRNEAKYTDLATLQKHIAADAAQARTFLNSHSFI